MSATSREGYSQKLERARESMLVARESLAALADENLVEVGLTQAEVAARVELGLTNAQDSSSSRSLGHILRSNLLTLFNAVVGGSFLLLLILGQWKDALFGFAVISNVVIGVVQEYRSKRALDRVAVLNQPKARVLRNGETLEVALAEVVVDDILVVRAGDQIPADALLLHGDDLELDESLLTGESDAVEKSPGDALLSGSLVVTGSGRARTVRVGIESYASLITLEARRFSMVSSELRNALSRVIRWISWALIPLMVIALNGQMQAVGGWQVAFSDGAWVHAAVASIASIISMIPQGLVLITSITFAVAAVVLSRRNVLVQELPAVEGLARVDVVCFDKTGTLTEGDIEFDTVEFLPGVEAVAAESALGIIAHAEDANETVKSLRPRFVATKAPDVVGSVAFNSARKWSAITLGDGATWYFGAPEMLLTPGASSESTLDRAQELAAQGLRTLLLCRGGVPGMNDSLPTGISPVALITLREKIRSDAADTIAYFLDQGLSLKVISGDNPATVAAVALKAGIPQSDQVVDARTLPGDMDELAAVLETHSVFGRVTPEQKKLMVLALRSRGHVVAMTGDGVNDALALKSADLGIAMGNGSAATKAVSRLVLLDSAFGSLPGVVAEGRRVIANVERVSRLFLTKTVWAMLLAVVFGVLLWPFPFLPRQLSAVDGYTIGIASFFLALLPNKRRYVHGFLKRALMFCIPAGLITGALVISADAYMRSLGMYQPAQTQTVIAVVLSLSGLWVLVALSRPFDRRKLAIVGAMYLMLAAVFGIAIVRDFFGFVVLPMELVWLGLGVGTIACLCIEIIDRIIAKVLARENPVLAR